MRQVELTATSSRLAPPGQKLAPRVELHDPVVAVTVRDIEIAVGSEGHVGGLVELSRPGSGLVGLAECQQQFSGGTVFQDQVVSDIRHPDIVLAIDSQAVSFPDQVVAPRSQKTSLVIEAQDRLFASVEEVNSSLAVDINTRGRTQRYRRRNLQKPWYRYGRFCGNRLPGEQEGHQQDERAEILRDGVSHGRKYSV